MGSEQNKSVSGFSRETKRFAGDEEPDPNICARIAALSSSGEVQAAADLLTAQIVPQQPLRRGQPHILCLSRDRFLLDLDVLRQEGSLNYPYLIKPYYDAFVNNMPSYGTTSAERRQSFYAPNQAPHVLEHKAHSLPYARAFLAALCRAIPDTRAILTANLDYWENWMLEEVRHEFGIKILTLSREHYVSQYLRDLKIDILRRSGFRYRGDGVAFFGEMSVPVYTSTAALQSEMIYITGAPRLDVWRYYKCRPEKMNTITLLAFSGRKYNAEDAFGQTLQEVVRSAASPFRRTLRYIIKCKDGTQRQAVMNILGPEKRKNIKIQLSNLFQVLSHSRLVIGTNSLAVLEALLSDAHIVAPYWADARQTPEQSVLDPTDELTRRCVTFAESPRELRRLITRAARSKPRPLSAEQRAERLALLRRYFYYPEHTTCTACVEKFLLSAIGQQN